MIAIFHDSGLYYGYKPLDNEGEKLAFELDYILVEKLPNALLNVPEGYYATVDVIDGQIVVTYVEIHANQN